MLMGVLRVMMVWYENGSAVGAIFMPNSHYHGTVARLLNNVRNGKE
jgi:hypothetical protein